MRDTNPNHHSNSYLLSTLYGYLGLFWNYPLPLNMAGGRQPIKSCPSHQK